MHFCLLKEKGLSCMLWSSAPCPQSLAMPTVQVAAFSTSALFFWVVAGDQEGMCPLCSLHEAGVGASSNIVSHEPPLASPNHTP